MPTYKRALPRSPWQLKSPEQSGQRTPTTPTSPNTLPQVQVGEPPRVKVVSDPNEAGACPWALADVWDFETTGLYWWSDKPYALAVLFGEQPYVFVGAALDVASGYMRESMMVPGKEVIGYNVKFDFHFASTAPIDVHARVIDPSLALFLLDENRFSGSGHGLKDAVKQLFGYKMVDFKSMLGRVTEETGEYKTRKCHSCSGKGWRGRDHSQCDGCAGVGTEARPVTRTRQRRIDEVPVEEMAQYAGEDVWWTKKVWEWAEPRLARHGALERNFYEVQMPLLVALYRAEHRGVRIDRDAVVALRDKYQARIEAIDTELRVRTGIVVEGATAIDDEGNEPEEDSNGTREGSTLRVNLGSPAQMDWLLYTFLGYRRPPFRAKRKTKDGGRVASKWQTDENCLLWIAKNVKQDVPRLLWERRKCAKYVGTYLNNMLEFSVEESPGVWVLYPNFNMTATKTGRLSSSKPMNFQNIPHSAEFRALFIARPGCEFIIADAKQIELRFLAHFSNDPALVGPYSDPKRDLHQETADMLHLEGKEGRYVGKTANFAEVYGVFGNTFAMQLFRDTEGQLDWTKDEAQDVLDRIRGSRPGVARWKVGVVARLITNKFVRTIEGRYRRLPGIESAIWGQKKYAERQGINTEIQGSVGDLFARLLGHEMFLTTLLLQVHDEVVCEVEQGQGAALAERIKAEVEAFTERYNMRVPILADVAVGQDWSDKA